MNNYNNRDLHKCTVHIIIMWAQPSVTHIWRLLTPACVLSDFLRQFWRKPGFMTPELGQRTSSTVGMLTVQCVCIFREVQWTILVVTARAL